MEGDTDMATETLTVNLTNPLSLPFLMMDVWNPASYNWLFALGRHLAVQFPSGESPWEAWEEWMRRNPLDVYGVALAWEEHAKEFAANSGRLAGAPGALFLAHAAYAGLMTGLTCDGATWQRLLAERGDSDPLVRFGYLLYELCHFRDAEKNGQLLTEFLAAPPAACREILELAGFLRGGQPTVRFGVAGT